VLFFLAIIDVLVGDMLELAIALLLTGNFCPSSCIRLMSVLFVVFIFEFKFDAEF
jgi:hypothetical protein